ncbi:MAG: hypothetical protein LLG00_07390, partial [Planctomycetaceae bacterium]|nr:hypothetical protein [Planctomycetaceae bacterium]
SRPTVSHTTISRSADAAMSADPRSLAESEFHDGFGETLYTADYTRVGPDLRGNTLVNNSINGLSLRTPTVAGGSLEELDVSARFDDVGTVLVVSENLTIAGGAGEAAYTTGTCALQASAETRSLSPNC